MKKIILLLVFVLSVNLFGQQVARQKVIVEVGTGTWCSACPAVVQIIHDLQNAGAEIAVVKYHVSDSFENADGLIRKNYYNFPWYPTTYYDSDHIGYNDWATYSVHYSYYQNRINTPSDFDISIFNVNVSGSEITGDIGFTNLTNYTAPNLSLHVVLTESSIPYSWQGETEVNYAERKMFPDGNGTSIDLSLADYQVIPFSFTLDPSWVTQNLQIVFFLQNNDTQEILQGDFVNVSNYLGTTSFDNSGIKLYPNPVDSELFISSTSGSIIKEIIITDITGKIVLQQDSLNGALSVNDLKSGVYIISFVENGIKKTDKFVKK